MMTMTTTVDPFADTMPAPPAWPKYCACGAVHSEERWQELRLVGRVAVAELELAAGAVVLACSSTIAIEVGS